MLAIRAYLLRRLPGQRGGYARFISPGSWDATYLLAGAHDLLGGTASRSAFDCNYDDLLASLRRHVETHASHLTFLRTYWYDGAREGLPTADHRRIGGLPYVKVRLGRLNQRGQQKGVDGLIYRDLTTLARAGALHRAYLFTGDEDLRESVAAAQDLGVQVVLMSFAPTRRTGRSAALVREVDEVVVLDHGFYAPHFTQRRAPAPTATPPNAQDLEAAATAFARQWAADATPEELLELKSRAPWMPRDLHVQLVLAAEAAAGSLRGHDQAKRDLRTHFWDVLNRETGTAAETIDEGAVEDEAASQDAEPA